MKPPLGTLRFWTSLMLLSGVACFPARAEIILLEGGHAISAEPAYVYAHPALRSLVFSSPQARDVAILPPVPYFVSAPPLLLRAQVPYAAYPPVVYSSGINQPVRPSNRDAASYSLYRAHAFSQKAYEADNDETAALYAWPYTYSLMPYYPPVNASGGFNQPARPSNRDNASYNLERAHRFSADAYKRP